MERSLGLVSNWIQENETKLGRSVPAFEDWPGYMPDHVLASSLARWRLSVLALLENFQVCCSTPNA